MPNLFHCCPVKDFRKMFTGQPESKWLRYSAIKTFESAVWQP